FGRNLILKQFLREQARLLGATLVVSALYGDRAVALCASGGHADTFFTGDNGPAYISACGKVLISLRSEADWENYVAKPESSSGSTCAKSGRMGFVSEMRQARASGVAWCVGERNPAYCSVAAPLRSGEYPWRRAVAPVYPQDRKSVV